jgi:hypothetical protein
MVDWRGYWLWPATEDAEKVWEVPLHYKEWKLGRILAEDLPRDFPFKIGDWLKRVLWTDHSSEDDEGFETISKIPPSNQLFPDQLALWSRWRNSPHDIGDYLTLFSVKPPPPATKKEVIDDPLANGYRVVPMPTSTCTNVIDWLEEILKERGKGFGFGVGLVPLEALEGGCRQYGCRRYGGRKPLLSVPDGDFGFWGKFSWWRCCSIATKTRTSSRQTSQNARTFRCGNPYEEDEVGGVQEWATTSQAILDFECRISTDRRNPAVHHGGK